MRKVQINIKMTIVDDQAADGQFEEVSVYADSNNLWETIVAGFHELVEALKDHGHRIPVFGAKEHYDR
jgi:biotin synthase-related radical SAM superfamily protein